MSNVGLPSGLVFLLPCGPMRIPKFGFGGGWGPITLSGGAAFRFPIVRRVDARACTFSIPFAGSGAVAPNVPLEFCGLPLAPLRTSVAIPVSSARVLPKLGGGPISGTAAVPSLAGGMGMGSRFAARFSLHGWFATRVRAGESGR